MRKLTGYIACFVFISCSADLEKTNETFRSTALEMMEAETKIEQQTHEQEILRIVSMPYLTSPDTMLYKDVKALLSETVKHPTQEESIDKLEQAMLTDINQRSWPKNKYSVSFSPFDLNHANPEDTARLQQLHNLFTLSKKTHSSSVKTQLLQACYTIYLHVLQGKTDVPYCCFFSIEPVLYAPKNTWEKNERAYVIPLMGEFNRSSLHFRIDGKEFREPAILMAPSQKGIHHIKGEIGIKQNGEIRWIPFSRQILVE